MAPIRSGSLNMAWILLGPPMDDRSRLVPSAMVSFQIYAMNSDGSNVRRLTKHNAEDSNPAWAPDGAAIAFISATGDDRRGLFIMGADGSGHMASRTPSTRILLSFMVAGRTDSSFSLL